VTATGGKAGVEEEEEEEEGLVSAEVRAVVEVAVAGESREREERCVTTVGERVF
jgi:hypothetical protein